MNRRIIRVGRSFGCAEFVRLPDGTNPPTGAIVLSSKSDCQNCDVIEKRSVPPLQGQAVDKRQHRLSSAHMNTILVFDLQGDRIGTLTPKPPDKLEGPSALAVANRKLYVLNMSGNR